MTSDNKIQTFLKKKLINDKIKRKNFIQGSGIPKSTFSKIINTSQLNPDLKTVLKIADYFKCSIDKIIGRKSIYMELNNDKFNSISIEAAFSNLRKLIKEKLIDFSLNPYELSKNCGFSSDAIRHFIRENNPQKTLGILVIVALADYFKVSIDEMIGRVPLSTQKMLPTEETKEISK
jgi:transcriptional regulator with XRE-family HTH domain